MWILLSLLSCTPATVEPEPEPEMTEPEPEPEPEPEDPIDPVDTIEGEPWGHPGVLIIDMDGVSIPQDEKVDGWVAVIRDHDGTLLDLADAPRLWEGHLGIEVHGSSSSGFEKKGYRIELRDEAGDDLRYGLLGMPAESDWVLHGPYSDKTLIRNALAYRLGRAISEGQWQPRAAFAEVIIDGVYQGVYLAVERIERSAARVDIPEVTDDDPSGGYIVKIDQSRGEGWETSRGTPIDYHEPKAEDISAVQDAWLQARFEALEDALSADDFAEQWPEHLDGASFIDHYIINELSLNVDGYRLSGYLYFDQAERDGRLVAGPLWDFNLAFGNSDYCYCWGAEGYVHEGLTKCGYGSQEPFWWSRLLEDPAYTSAMRCRWEALRGGPLSDEALVAAIAELSGEVAGAEVRDHAVWPTLGVDIWPNYYIGETWEDEVDYLEAWVLARAAWLDANLHGTCGG